MCLDEWQIFQWSVSVRLNSCVAALTECGVLIGLQV
jgi:hypothetical protein